MTKLWRGVLLLAGIALACGTTSAQISQGGTPLSFSLAVSDVVPTAEMPAVDVAQYLAEDEMAGKDVPYRFGAELDVAFTLDKSGAWETLPDGGRLWRLRIASPGAFSMNLLFDRYFLPPGATLFVYNDERDYVIGAFTDFNNFWNYLFATQPVPGDAITLEYYEPANVVGQGELSIYRVIHAYRNLFGRPGAVDNYGDSGACNNNVNCPIGAPWQSDKRGVAMIISNGSRICTGSLVNNVRQDRTPYFLTANHCLGGSNTWVFMFNYESPGCANQNGPTNQTVSNSTLRASNSASDFALLQLSSAVPPSYNPYFNGWNNVDAAGDSSVCIHHPSGDIKKITFDYGTRISSTWSGTPANSHWRIATWESGTTEPGSSGSPLFDKQHRIVGQLHGGTASCSNNIDDYFGKFSMSWNYGGSASSRLRDWLDPDNTGATTLNGLDGSATITVTAPNGGETWYTGTTQNITWTSSGVSGNVKIDINRTYPVGSWETLFASIANDGSEPWLVAGTTSSTARIRVSSVSTPSIEDISNNNFTIANRTITVTSPNGGESWATGESNNLTWTSAGLSENVKIELNRSYPAGAWEVLFASTTNDGVEAWTATTPTTTTARIRITGTVTTTVGDTSNANFSIVTRSITVTSPNGGETWLVGEGRNLTWTSVSIPGNVAIDLNRNYPAGAWESITASTSNSGTYPWIVSVPATTTARIRVTSLSYPAVNDVSNANFTIAQPNSPPQLWHDPLDDSAPATGVITAIATDDQGVAFVRMLYRLAGAPTFDSLLLGITGNPDEYASNLPATPGNYEYFVKAIDSQGLTVTIPPTAPAVLYRYTVGTICATGLAYDDGSAERFNWSEDESGIFTQWAVKFGPVATPYVLCGAQFAASRSLPDAVHTPVQIHVYAADGPNGTPGTLLQDKVVGSIGNVVGGVPTGTNWAQVILKDDLGGPLLINTPEFYVAVSNIETGKLEAFGRDANGPRYHRSYFYDPCEDLWFSEDDTLISANAHPGNRLIRAQGYSLEPPTVVIASSGNDIILYWNNTGAPLYRIYSAGNPNGPFLNVEGTSTGTSFVDVGAVSEGAILFYQVRAETQ